MAALGNIVFDDGLSGGLDAIAERLVILNADPGLTWSNIASFELGEKTSIGALINAPTDRGGGGREVVVDAITDGSVDVTDTATHWAITDDSATLILATAALSSPQAVTDGNTFTLTSFTIGIPDPA